MRLTPRAVELGLVSAERRRQFEGKAAQRQRLGESPVRVDGVPLAQWLKRPEHTWQALPEDIRGSYDGEVWDLFETDVKYEGYIRRQETQVARASQSENRSIPQDFDFSEVQGLRREAAEKLLRVQPTTLGQAARISGVTPADLSLLSVWVERRRASRE
jgi:tRNA uridine 5-carboxymethylaminomethyl modification enzyme